MRASMIRKKLANSLFLLMAVAGIVLIVTGVVNILTPDTFWQNYSSNTLATMVGILVGLPVTLVIASIQETFVEGERQIDQGAGFEA